MVDGALGIIGFLIKVIGEFISNPQFMIPIAILYLSLMFFGSFRMRVATLIAFLFVIWLAIVAGFGITQGSIIGLLVIIVLFFWKKLVPLLRAALEGLLGWLKPQHQRLRERFPGTPGSPDFPKPKLPAKPRFNTPSMPKLPTASAIKMPSMPKMSAKPKLKLPHKPKFAQKMQRGRKG